MPSIDPLLHQIEPGWVGVEIGVCQGHSAKALLDHGVKFLYLIDPWENDGIHYSTMDEIWEECYRTVISQYPSRHAVLKMPSSDAARYVPGGLDFVWIDGDHRYEWVRADIENYWPKVREGGILCGHDYHDDGNRCRVKLAVDRFAAWTGRNLETPLPCWMVRK